MEPGESGLFAWLSLIGGAMAGFGPILFVATTSMRLQLTTSDAYHGRVMRLYTVMRVGTAPFGR